MFTHLSLEDSMPYKLEGRKCKICESPKKVYDQSQEFLEKVEIRLSGRKEDHKCFKQKGGVKQGKKCMFVIMNCELRVHADDSLQVTHCSVCMNYTCEGPGYQMQCVALSVPVHMLG